MKFQPTQNRANLESDTITDQTVCQAGIPGFYAFAVPSSGIEFVVRKKTTWWNRPLKPWWTVGSLIGFGISVLIASQIARWLAVSLAVLGCIFAAAFRFARKDGDL